MAPSKRPPKAVPPRAKRPPGRPRSPNPLPNVTGLRMPPELTEALDAWAAELDAAGPGRVTRSSLIVHILREAVAKRAAGRGP